MNRKLVGFIGILAILAPVGASAMPAAGLAPIAAPQATVEGAKLDRVVLVVRTGPVVRRGVVARPFVRRGFVGRPGIGVRGPAVGVRVGPRGGVGVRIR